MISLDWNQVISTECHGKTKVLIPYPSLMFLLKPKVYIPSAYRALKTQQDFD
jgi:hypothetical protein